VDVPVAPGSDPVSELVEQGSLTAAEIAALAAADAVDGWDPCAGTGAGMPAELMALGGQELQEVYAAARVCEVAAAPVTPQWPLSYRTAQLPPAPADPTWPGGAGAGAAGGEVTDGSAPGGSFGDIGAADGGGTGDGVVGGGFSEGGVLDRAAASVALAGFAEDAFGRMGGLDDDSLVGVLRAWRRVGSWAQAREMAVVAELTRRRPQPGTPPGTGDALPGEVSEFVGDEVAAALTLTIRAGEALVGRALALAARAQTAAALAAGWIDVPKALVMIELLAPLGPDEAAAVEAAVLPVAAGLTTGQLRAKVARLVLELDPGAARKRREGAEKQAHVACWTDPEGTATLAGRFLPPAQVLAADRRLCAIATAWKKQGAQGGMDLLRAHAFLTLLNGLDTTTPPAALLAPGTEPSPDDPAGPHAHGRTDERAGAHGQDGPDDHDGQAVPAGLRPAAGPALPPLTGTVQLTIPLLTLLRLADRAGEAPGHGPLHADTCRTLADSMARHHATQWGIVITSPTGQALSFGGPARLRSTRPPRSRPQSPTTRGSPAAGSGRDSPGTDRTSGTAAASGADGWTITLTTQPIAPDM
jgi:hypothetical protein